MAKSRENLSLKPLHTAILFILMNQVPFTAMRLAVPLYALHLDANPAVVGAIVALFSALPMLGSVYLGRWIDRKGVRLPMLLSSALLGGASLLAVLWPSLPMLFCVTSLGGGAYATILIAGHQLVGRYGSAAERVSNFSSLSTCFAVSLAAVPMATGFLIDHAGYTVTFAGMAVLPPLATLIILLGKLSQLGPVSAAPVSPPVAASATSTTSATSATSATPGTLGLMRNDSLLQLYGFSILFTVSWDMFLFMTPIYGSQLYLSASQIGVVVGSFSVAMFLARLMARRMNDRFTARQLLLLCLSVAGAGALGFGFVGIMPLLVLFAFTMGLGQGLANPTLNALLYDASPPDRIAEAMGLRTSIAKACQVVLPLGAGALSAALGAAPVFWLIGVMQMGAAFMARRQWHARTH